MAHLRRRARPGSLVVGAAAVMVLLAGQLATAGAGVAGRAVETSEVPVDDEVRAQLAESGEASFWVRFERRPQPDEAAPGASWADQGQAVVSQLQNAAGASQEDVRRLLADEGVEFKPFWAVNAIKVTAGSDVVDRIARRPGVAEIVADRTYQPAGPTRGPDDAAGRARTQAVEWNIARVRAPEVWSQLGTRGEGVVVATIATGAEYDHPALVNSYRGNLGGGAFDHNYNWFDPTGICGDPSLVPCDPLGLGTHVTGTLVGDDGGDNQIGVAPGARWMTAAGCGGACPLESLIAAGQWLLAPTDLTGANPRPDLRPNVISLYSWDFTADDPFYADVVRSWLAAGIFPVMSPGGNGSCGAAESPGDYPESYSVGGFDRNDEQNGGSGRGPTSDGSIKPDISAPAYEIRSSVPGGGYEEWTGSSLAPAHVAGTVALMWSAAPVLIGDVEATRALLDQTAVDRSDLSCGGEPGNNNVWGEGVLDAFGAVERSPRAPIGVAAGRVTDADTGAPVTGARVHVAEPVGRVAFADSEGRYRAYLPVGTSVIDVTAFGFVGVTEEVTVADGGTVTLDVELTRLPTHTLSGTVRDGDGDGDGAPVLGATVRLPGAPRPEVVTDGAGAFTIPDVPEGERRIEASGGGCVDPQTRTVVVTGDAIVDFTLLPRPDPAGYTCRHVPADYVEADTVLPLSQNQDPLEIDLPFPFWFYGHSHDRAIVSPNGYLSFLEPDRGGGGAWVAFPLPNDGVPDLAIYAFLDYLRYDDASSVRAGLVGQAPDRRFVVEWRDVLMTWGPPGQRISFEIVLDERGGVEMSYGDLDSPWDRGNRALIAIEDAGDVFLQYSYRRSVLQPGVSLRFEPPPSGFIDGRVTDAADDGPIAGAVVRVMEDGTVVRTITTEEDGTYRVVIPVGSYAVEADYHRIGTESLPVVVDEPGASVAADFELAFAEIAVAPDELDLVVLAGQTRTETITVGNGGLAPLEFEVLERPRSAMDGTGDPAGAGLPVVERVSRPVATDQGTEANPALARGPVLLVMDDLPFDRSTAMTEAFGAAGIPHDVVESAQLADIDLDAYQAVIISNDQRVTFYDNVRAALPLLTEYVEQGGFFWMGAAVAGHAVDIGGLPLPGGATVVLWQQIWNDVVDAEHPIVQGVPARFGEFSSLAAFENLPEGTHVVARGDSDPRPTIMEYGLGAGRVLGTGGSLELARDRGQDWGRILDNAAAYAHGFVPSFDVPWLSVTPTSGTVASGGSEPVEVTVDTAGLAPGRYEAQVSVRSNDPYRPRGVVPVTLTVPELRVAVDVGASGPYTDSSGDTWAADQRYAPGGWGYTNGRSSRLDTGRSIAGTADDRLFQTTRGNPREYRFDGMPDGVYEVDLRFAETNGRRPGRRLADVVIEGSLVLPRHDISGEVGTFAADRHTVLVSVTDGQLNIELVQQPGFGAPIVSALRITRRPDG